MAFWPETGGFCMSGQTREVIEGFKPGADLGTSPWLTVTQEMIDGFGAVTLDPDPMHIDPAWSRTHSPFGGTIAFGFLTISLLTHLLHQAMNTSAHRDPADQGYFLNYGFDRLRLVAPVPVGSRIRGRFKVLDHRQDERGRWVNVIDSMIEIENSERPALVAEWLSVWVPPEAM